MAGIDWMGTPLEDFLPSQIISTGQQIPAVSGELMVRLALDVGDTYARLVSPDDYERLETAGQVPIIRDGRRGYAGIESLTLRDLPAILDTFEALSGELQQRQAAESERKAAARKERERIRAKERRKLKKLGEWEV